MPKDNRRILTSVRVTGKPLFTAGMEDELAAELGGQRLDELKSEGVLSGDWKSTRNGGGISVNGDASLANRSSGFVPLPVDETIKRFQEFDFSDEVMRSMQFHKEAIKSNVGSTAENDSKTANDANSDGNGAGAAAAGSSAKDSSNANSNKEDSDEEFPSDFPARSKFIKADKTFAEVKTLSREKLLEIDGIADKTADDVLSYIAELGK